jgi:hypothetical protein
MEAQVGRQLATGALALAVLTAGCASDGAQPAVTTPTASAGDTAGVEALATAWEVARSDGLDQRQFQPDDYWEILLPVLAAQPDRFAVTEVGRSIEGRPIRRIDFGHGATTVMLWSQMHGNESTASRALVDIFRHLAANPDDELVGRIESDLAITVVPVLNPDGAARFVRHNAIGVDINRDAKRLATPEGRTLKAVRDSIDADWGFNLHDQNVRTRLGRSGRDVRIALLAPPPGAGATSPANQAARQMCSYLAASLAPIVGDQIARYDESFNPRAFGDLMTSWGTAVVLVESGGELDDPHKELLRKANFAGILTALDAIATRRFEQATSERYFGLPLNAPWIYDLVVRGASIVLPGRDPVRADFAVNFDDTLGARGGSIVEVGDLEVVTAMQEIDASGLFYVPSPRALGPELGPYLRIGAAADGVLARDPAGTDVVRRFGSGE